MGNVFSKLRRELRRAQRQAKREAVQAIEGATEAVASSSTGKAPAKFAGLYHGLEVQGAKFEAAIARGVCPYCEAGLDLERGVRGRSVFCVTCGERVGEI